MYIEEASGLTVFYPAIHEDNGSFNRKSETAVVVAPSKDKVAIFHRNVNSRGELVSVPVTGITKDSLQKYINELQKICDKLE